MLLAILLLQRFSSHTAVWKREPLQIAYLPRASRVKTLRQILFSSFRFINGKNSSKSGGKPTAAQPPDTPPQQALSLLPSNYLPS